MYITMYHYDNSHDDSHDHVIPVVIRRLIVAEATNSLPHLLPSISFSKSSSDVCCGSKTDQ